ncbi:MAG: ABC transporter permease subunit [Desulfurococcaceae archaeon]|nr:ABC transporter permease subunit [Desulfurococcaceae archaeon]
MNSVYVVVWKELKDMLRDIRTLAAIAFLPLLILPLMSLTSIYAQGLQPGYVALINYDKTSGSVGGVNITSEDILKEISEALEKNGLHVIYGASANADATIIIKEGFAKNLTSLTERARLEIIKTLGSSKADQVENIVLNLINDLNFRLASLKVIELSGIAGLNVSVDSVLRPVEAQVSVVGVGGAPVSYEEAIRVYISRFLSFSLIFVTTPSTAYITDSVIGEKERKTLEALLSTPVPRHALIIGKVVSTSLIGLLTGFTNALGLLLFAYVPSLIYGINLFYLIPGSVMLAHFIAIYFSVLSSLALVTPAVIRSGSYRAAQASSMIIISVATIVFFISLYVDIEQLSNVFKWLLYLIPYTHASLFIKFVALGMLREALTHLTILLLVIAGLMYVSIKLFNEERIIYGRT